MRSRDFDLVLSANLRSTFLVCRAVGRALLERGREGRIVNISSQMGSVGYPRTRRVLRQQACGQRPDQGARGRVGAAWDYGQRSRADLHQDAAHRRDARRRGLPRGRDSPSADRSSRRGRRRHRRGRLSRLAGREADHRHRAARGRRLDRLVAPGEPCSLIRAPTSCLRRRPRRGRRPRRRSPRRAARAQCCRRR